MNHIKTLQKDQELWDLFTRKEEYNSSIRDKYDRFPYYTSSNRNIFEPQVSRYLIEQGFHVEYPEGKPFAVCLTHDIDEIYQKKAVKGMAALRHLYEFRFSMCMRSLLMMRSKKLPAWNLSDIMALEERYGAKSSFYFMVQNRDDRDYTYDIEDCETIIREISDNGWEVGLHGGHTAYNNLIEIKEKKTRLEKVLTKNVVGYRNHFLRFRVPDTWEHLSSAGFHYDTTLGYQNCIGFRNGMCHPFKPYNLITQREIDILEIPLMIMDRTPENDMNLDFNTAWEMIRRLIDTVAECHGVVTLLWHNTWLIGEQSKIYERILRYCAEKDAWMTSGEQISKWWKHNVKD